MTKKPVLFATLAVVVAGAAGATSVFLVGSKQRRDDRRAYLAYERAVLVPIRDGGRVVQQEMKPSLDQLRRGEITAADARARAGGWRRAFAAVRVKVLALTPPSFLRDVELRFLAAIDGYATIAVLFDRAAGEDGAARASLLDAAAAAGRRADTMFDRASSIMQFHRRRLGLGATTKLPDPAATEVS